MIGFAYECALGAGRGYTWGAYCCINPHKFLTKITPSQNLPIGSSRLVYGSATYLRVGLLEIGQKNLYATYGSNICVPPGRNYFNAEGKEIVTDIVLNPITSGYNVSRINANFDAIEDTINGELLHTEGGNNTMNQDLDMNSFALLNVQTNPNDPESLLTVGEGDARYYNISGDTLTGPMNVNQQQVTNLRQSVSPTDAVRKQELTDEIAARVSGDASLQAQLNGVNPPMGSAFSVISWHDQSVSNSINIPDNKNAWSFGPTLTIDAGQTVTIGAGSFWTIANGEVQP